MKVKIGSKTHLKEAQAAGFSKNPSKYKVVLIQEGLGNLRDCFYYTKGCLQNATDLFEGSKCFADHPSQIEEQARPERSTRDIIGHFENVQYAEYEDGRGCLEADLMVLPGSNYDWARALISNSLEYAKKYPTSDFVGLSINASGEASQVPIDEFLKGTSVPQSILEKIDKAKDEGITEIRPVSLLKDAISCDLVTEAGAGGKILKMIEGAKKAMSKRKVKESEDEAKMKMKMKQAEDEAHKEDEDGDMAGQGDDDGHDDADQDKELFAKMIKQYLGDDHGEDQEAHEMAKHAYEAYQAEGMKHDEAYQAAGQHLKMAKAIGEAMMKQMKQKKEAHKEDEDGGDDHEEPKPAPKAAAPDKDGDGDGDDHDAHESEDEHEHEKKESSSKSLIKAKAEIARLAEALKKYELTEYLEKKLRESKKPVTVTKKFREALGTPKSKVQIDEAYKIFMAAYEAKQEEDASNDSYFVFTEKTHLTESDGTNGKVKSFEDCVK